MGKSLFKWQYNLLIYFIYCQPSRVSNKTAVATLAPRVTQWIFFLECLRVVLNTSFIYLFIFYSFEKHFENKIFLRTYFNYFLLLENEGRKINSGWVMPTKKERDDFFSFFKQKIKERTLSWSTPQKERKSKSRPQKEWLLKGSLLRIRYDTGSEMPSFLKPMPSELNSMERNIGESKPKLQLQPFSHLLLLHCSF